MRFKSEFTCNSQLEVINKITASQKQLIYNRNQEVENYVNTGIYR